MITIVITIMMETRKYFWHTINFSKQWTSKPSTSLKQKALKVEKGRSGSTVILRLLCFAFQLTFWITIRCNNNIISLWLIIRIINQILSFFFLQFIFRCINVKSGITLLHLSGVMKALDRSVETLGLWIVTSSVTFIKSANQCSIKLCLIVHLVAVWTLIYPSLIFIN